MDTLKERLLAYIEFKGISVQAFEKEADLSNGAVSKMGDNTRKNTLDKISNVFTDLNISWLRTGEGEMIHTSNNDTNKKIDSSDIQLGIYSGTLVYDIDATCGTDGRDIDFATDCIIGSIDLPFIDKTSQIIKATGDSMEPKIHNGDLVVIREIHDFEDIFYGQIYLILLDEYRMLKYIRKYEPDEENYIVLRSKNKEYDDIKIHKSKIRKLFIVENILSIQNQI